MKRLLTIAQIVLLLFMGGCTSEYDDSAVWKEINSINERIEYLDKLCSDLNNDIEALQTVITALQNNDYVTSVSPIIQGGETIGYTISFSKSGIVNIYNGEDGADGKDGAAGEDGKDGADGKDGYTPQIGVRQDSTGQYFWTIDGEWLLDSDGNKIPTSMKGADGADGKDGANGEDGKDGADGTTPKFKIENDYWYVSYDNGNTWQMLGKATGEDGSNGQNGNNGSDGADGKDGEDGKDGVTPQFKIENGYWYISYDNGNTWQVLGKATGEDGSNGQNGNNGTDGKDGADGKDGITPKLKIEDDYWYVSYDNGDTWQQLYRATGEDGKDGANGIDGTNGDSFFKSVTQDAENVYFEFIDGTIITIPFGSSNTLYIQSIDYVPVYSDGKALVEGDSLSECYVVMDFEITPREAIDVLVKEWQSLLNIKATEVITRAATLIEMEIIEFEADSSNGVISIKASGANLGNEFFEGDKSMSIRVEVSDGYFSYKSAYIPIVTKNHSKPDAPYVPEIPDIEDNQIIYTSTDGNIITPLGVFYEYMVSNTYEDGYGVLTLDRPIYTMDEAAFDRCETLTSIVIPNRVHTIQQRAFANCTNLRAVYMQSANVTEIRRHAFLDCPSLVVVELGNHLEYIRFSAFSGCKNLRELHLPNSLIEIEDHAFSGCTLLSNIDMGNGIKRIEEGAFKDCKCLEEITFPDSLIEIGDDLFSGCDNLRRVTLGDEIKVIGDRVFKDCTQLEEIIGGESLEEIGSNAFENCQRLKDVPTSDNLTTIGERAFADCPTFTKIKLHNPKHPIVIALDGFAHCISIGLLELGSGVSVVGDRAFYGCIRLKTIVISSDVLSIGNMAFFGCSSLNSVRIPKSVQRIGTDAFYDCITLNSVYCEWETPPTVSEDWRAFENTDPNLLIYIPKGTKDAYCTATGWSRYADRYIEVEPETTEPETTE